MAEYPQKAANAHWFLSKISQFVSPPGRLFDFGCFCGIFLLVARQEGWDGYGLEPLPGPALFAGAYFGLDVITSTLREALYPDGYFDLVTAFQVFEHLPSPAATLALLKPMIRRDGLLIVEVPNIDTVWFRLLRSRTRCFVRDHLFFSPTSLTMLLEKQGFHVLETGCSVRAMSLRWFLGQLPVQRSFRDLMLRMVRMLGVDSPVISVNIHDIIYVVVQNTP